MDIVTSLFGKIRETPNKNEIDEKESIKRINSTINLTESRIEFNEAKIKSLRNELRNYYHTKSHPDGTTLTVTEKNKALIILQRIKLLERENNISSSKIRNLDAVQSNLEINRLNKNTMDCYKRVTNQNKNQPMLDVGDVEDTMGDLNENINSLNEVNIALSEPLTLDSEYISNNDKDLEKELDLMEQEYLKNDEKNNKPILNKDHFIKENDDDEEENVFQKLSNLKTVNTKISIKKDDRMTSKQLEDFLGW